MNGTALRTTIAAGVAGLGLSVGGISLALAADGTATESVTSITDGHGPGLRGMHSEEHLAELAEALGVTTDELADAFEAVHEELAPERPADGEMPSPPTEEEIAARHDALASALAEELGLEKATVADALEELRSAAEAEGRSLLEERLDAAVADGDLTEADKASVLKAYDAGVLGRHGHGGPGGPGGPGAFRGMR